MTGRVLIKGTEEIFQHDCHPPSSDVLGTVWQCDCGRAWMSYRSTVNPGRYPWWAPISQRRVKRLLRKAKK